MNGAPCDWCKNPADYLIVYREAGEGPDGDTFKIPFCKQCYTEEFVKPPVQFRVLSDRCKLLHGEPPTIDDYTE